MCADNPLFSARNKEFKYFLPFVRVFRFSLSFFAQCFQNDGANAGRRGGREILKLNYFVNERKKKKNTAQTEPKGDSKSISLSKKGALWWFFFQKLGFFLFFIHAYICVRVFIKWNSIRLRATHFKRTIAKLYKAAKRGAFMPHSPENMVEKFTNCSNSPTLFGQIEWKNLWNIELIKRKNVYKRMRGWRGVQNSCGSAKWTRNI